MATGCFSWQYSFLCCTSAGFISQSSCAASTAHIRHSHPLHTHRSPGRSVTHSVSSTGWASKHGMCMSTHLRAVLALLSDPMNGAPGWITAWAITLCHSLDFQKCHLHFWRKSFDVQKSTLVKGKTIYYFCCFSLETNNKVSTPWIRLITAVEKFLEGLYFTFNLFIWFRIYLCDKAAVGGRGKNWCSWVASWHWWPACTWSALTPAASRYNPFFARQFSIRAQVSRNGKRLIDQEVPKNLHSERNEEWCGWMQDRLFWSCSLNIHVFLRLFSWVSFIFLDSSKAVAKFHANKKLRYSNGSNITQVCYFCLFFFESWKK